MELSVGYEELQKKAHELGENELLPRASISDPESASYPHESLKAIAEAGFGAVTIPTIDGGLGAGLTGFAVLQKALLNIVHLLLCVG